MFAKKEVINFENVDTFVGIHTTVKGNIKSGGSVRIDGKVDGDVVCGGSLTVGEKAEIKGCVKSGDVTISGIIRGNVDSSGIMILHSTAKIYGDVKMKSLVTDEGSILQGKCEMSEPEPEPVKTNKIKAAVEKVRSAGKNSHKDNLQDTSENTSESA